jgi:hypothetical protein
VIRPPGGGPLLWSTGVRRVPRFGAFFEEFDLSVENPASWQNRAHLGAWFSMAEVRCAESAAVQAGDHLEGGDWQSAFSVVRYDAPW